MKQRGRYSHDHHDRNRGSVVVSAALIGRVAIVTGAAGGIGFACAAALHERGASVALADLDAERVAGNADGLGERAIGVGHDVTVSKSSDHLVTATIRAFGRIDILINNAGVGPRPAPVQSLEPDEFDRVMGVNVRGTFLTTRAVTPHLIASKDRGRIVNIASVMGQSADVEVCHYVASKHAVIGLTRAWALELAAHGVTVNAVCPGSVTTEMHDKVITAYAAALGITEEESRANFLSRMPLGRFQSPADVAAAAAFLASDDARNITGTQLGVDGGWVLH